MSTLPDPITGTTSARGWLYDRLVGAHLSPDVVQEMLNRFEAEILTGPKTVTLYQACSDYSPALRTYLTREAARARCEAEERRRPSNAGKTLTFRWAPTSYDPELEELHVGDTPDPECMWDSIYWVRTVTFTDEAGEGGDSGE